MATTLPNYYAQETLRIVQRPRPELQSLLSELGLPHALLDSSRIDGDMAPETYGRLFIALLKQAENDLHQDPDPILDLSTYRLMFVYMLLANCLEGAIALSRAEPLSGSAIAEKPGFSDASTFYRAFKK